LLPSFRPLKLIPYKRLIRYGQRAGGWEVSSALPTSLRRSSLLREQATGSCAARLAAEEPRKPGHHPERYHSWYPQPGISSLDQQEHRAEVELLGPRNGSESSK